MTGLLEHSKEPGAYLRGLSSLVFKEIEATLEQIKGSRAWRRMLLEPINAQKGSGGRALLRRSFMTLSVCRSLCGRVEHALPAGAALEFFAAALDVFDDLEDQDSGDALWRKYGQAQAMNAATALLMLAQSALVRLRVRGVDELIITRAMEALASAGTTACTGQHRDLQYESVPCISEAQYFKMTGMKSGALVECACRLGAVTAGSDDYTVEALGLFGRNLGMAAQITNDVGSIRLKGSGKSDIARRKKILPVIFALGHARPEERGWLAGVYSAGNPVDVDTEQRVIQLLQRSGAVHYSLVRAELFRQKAGRALEKARLPGPVNRKIRQDLGI